MRARLPFTLALAATACGRVERARDSTAATDSIAIESAGWVGDLGPLFIVRGENDSTGVAVHPPNVDADTTGVVRLILLGGTVSRPTTAVLDADSVACGDAPAVRLDGPVPPGWTIGIGAGAFTVPPVDSIESLSSADSSKLVADVARLASAGAHEALTARGRFTGLPFVVLKAYRVNYQGRVTLYANVLRRLPQEAEPLEQRGFVVGEGHVAGSYEPRIEQWSEGKEENAVHVTLLAVLHSGDREIAIVEQEGADGTTYGIHERGADGQWKTRWSRTLVC